MGTMEEEVEEEKLGFERMLEMERTGGDEVMLVRYIIPYL